VKGDAFNNRIAWMAAMPEAMADENVGGRIDVIEAMLDNLVERQREFQIIQEHDHERFGSLTSGEFI
jgi:hypothetical protein